jgi:predicted nucleic acid-binding protein
MRVLLDTNVVLDVLLHRDPWFADSSAVWAAHDDGRINGYITATLLTDIFYVSRKLPPGSEGARAAIQTCLDTFDICTVDRHVLMLANSLSGKDFEDNLQLACTQHEGLDAIATRDVDGFKDAGIRVLSPAALLVELDT